MKAWVMAAAMLATPGLGAAYTSAWVAPFDDFSSENWACFDEINPFALAFDSKQRIVVAHPTLLAQAEAAKPAGMPLIPVIVNDVFDRSGLEIKTLKSVSLLHYWLGDARRLNRHVEDLARAAEPYDGIELDYERIPASLWPNFVELVEKLSDLLHARGKRLGVDLESGPLFRSGGMIARRHWPRLAAAADKIKVMCYYERGEFSREPGPGSSTSYVDQVAERTLAYVPAPKAAMALSLAATDWQLPLRLIRARRQVARLHFRRARELQQRMKAVTVWDPGHAAPFFRYEQDGRAHEVWYEDETTLKAKIDAARRHGAGVSLWYLGATRPDLHALGLCK
jgi:spore germination protein YaaH